jgi:hypothetical protein
MAATNPHDYSQLTGGEIHEIEEIEHGSMDMKILRVFLTSVEERCLHLPKTLTQYYYVTLADADESFQDQVVYKFALKQHSRRMEKERREGGQHGARARERMERVKWERPESLFRPREEVQDDNTAYVKERESARAAAVSWDPPKVIMVKFFMTPFTHIRISYGGKMSNDSITEH